MGVVKINLIEIYTSPIEAEIIRELCSMRDNGFTTDEFTRDVLYFWALC